MKSPMIIAAAAIMTVAISAPVGTIAYAQQTGTQMQQPQKNQMGGQMGGQGGMMGMQSRGGGMMGMMKKMRKQMMGKNFMVRKKAYSNADIKRMIDGRLATFGFSNLKAGDVADSAKKPDAKKGGPKTAVVDVLSTKGEFLFKVEVNRKTGMAAIVE
ncbi:hypothetical protein MNBD_ALPHA08-1246 [hydrothermal vent metagenome]|uniref:Uncharacterized protein n=1 Tax=hydrothermal vent metagenome TaxID=652676 RepID=A0A3B0RCE6_9ZZZZ